MSKIAAAFKKQRKCFIPFITAGDPNLDVTEQLIIAMANAGADIVELGIPFSDPVAEGEVIQAANIRALSAGTTTDKIFAMLKNVRTKTDVPLVFLTYINPIFTYGTEKFLANCQSVGLDGIIVPDVPYEEKAPLAELCRKYGVDLIPLVAPTSDERIKMIAKEAEGYVYIVSSLGVTRYRRAQRHYHRYCRYDGKNTPGNGCSGGSWFWHSHAEAGRRNGGSKRRRDCWQRSCKNSWQIRYGLCAAC